MPEEVKDIMDPGATLAIKLLDNMITNGTSLEMIALGEGVKASIQVSCSNNIKITKHIDNEDVHTAKGILLRKDVIRILLGLIVLISAIVMYVPDLVKWLFGFF